MELEQVHFDYKINEELAQQFNKLHSTIDALTTAYRQAENEVVKKVL